MQTTTGNVPQTPRLVSPPAASSPPALVAEVDAAPPAFAAGVFLSRRSYIKDLRVPDPNVRSRLCGGFLFTLVFGAGAVMAGLAGLMIAPITEASIGMGNEILIVAFVVIVIGGIGSIKGAFVGALVVGLIDTLGRSFLDDMLKLVLSNQAAETSAPAISAMLIYILMAAILYFRPQGLFPPRGR